MECRYSLDQEYGKCQSCNAGNDYCYVASVFLAMYEKDGQPLEVIAGHFIQAKFIRPKIRPFRTDNYYDVLMRQYQLEKEVEKIVFQEENADKRGQDACKSEPQTAERD